MKPLLMMLAVGFMLQQDVDHWVELQNKAEAKQVQTFWQELKCGHVVTAKASVIGCVEAHEVWTKEEPKEGV